MSNSPSGAVSTHGRVGLAYLLDIDGAPGSPASQLPHSAYWAR